MKKNRTGPASSLKGLVTALAVLLGIGVACADKRDPISPDGWPFFKGIPKAAGYAYRCDLYPPFIQRYILGVFQYVPVGERPLPYEGVINNCFVGNIRVASIWINHAKCPADYTLSTSMGGVEDDVCVPSVCPAGQVRDATLDCVCAPGLVLWNGQCRSMRDAGPPCDGRVNMGAGDPIHIGTGNNYQAETDYAGEPGFGRDYNSITDNDSGSFGNHWRGRYHASLTTSFADTSVQANRANGKRIGFKYYTSLNAWRPTQDINDTLVKLANNAGWSYSVGSDGSVEIYDISGKLLSIRRPNGALLTLGYDESRLATVTDAFGRSLTFSYDGLNRVATLTPPDGQQIQYSYDANNLSAVTYPDTYSKQYLYEDAAFPHALTGLVDENNNRYVTWQYGSDGLAYSSEHAGGVDRTTLVFNTGSTDVTDALGTVRTYPLSTQYGSIKATGVNQPGGSGCGPSASSYGYDSSRNVGYQTDFDGHVTTYSYETGRQLETERIEWTGSSATRITRRSWHPDSPLETRRAEPKKMTTWVYNGQPDPTAGNAIASCAPAGALLPDGKPITVLCKRVEQATTDATGGARFAATVTGSPRNWTWTYNQYGQVLTAKGPRTDANDTTTYTYYGDTTADHTLGDLATVSNAAGHVTQYTRYDRSGRALEIHGPNGVVTNLTYSPRGWLWTRQVGSELTTYDYDNVGQLKKVTMPDSSWIGYDYDNAHRLADIYDSRGNRITYTLDNAGNRTKEDVTDPNGVLVRTQTRVYDALSRLQNIIQPQ